MQTILGKFGLLAIAGVLVALSSLVAPVLVAEVGEVPAYMSTLSRFGLWLGVVVTCFAVGFIWRSRE